MALIWSVVLAVAALAEAQRFSIIRSLVSIAILFIPYQLLNPM